MTKVIYSDAVRTIEKSMASQGNVTVSEIMCVGSIEGFSKPWKLVNKNNRYLLNNI